MSAAKRRALGLFRIDDRVDTHLRWGRGSALARMTDAGGSGRAVTLASRAARDAIFAGPETELHTVAGRVAAAVSEIGGRAYGGLQPGLEPQGASSTSALLLHEGRIPLTSAGLGTRRLTSIAVQEIAAIGGDMVITANRGITFRGLSSTRKKPDAEAEIPSTVFDRPAALRLS